MSMQSQNNLGQVGGFTGLTPFDALPTHKQELWMRNAVEHLDRTGISFEEDAHDVVIYLTAIWLYQLSDHTITKQTYPCYVVHCIEEGWRFVTNSSHIAFNKWKRAAQRNAKNGGNRVALFYYKKAHEQVRKYATEGYPYDKDYAPI